MKTKIFLGLLGISLVVAVGCVKTVSGGKTGANPFVQDQLSGNYERPLNTVYDAAKEVMTFNGTLVKESILHTETNEVKTVEGKVNQRDVWIRVESKDPKVTGVAVQVRTPNGGSDLPLAHELEKQISLKLVGR